VLSLRGRAIAASARPSACIVQRRRVSGWRRRRRRGTAMRVGGREQRGRVHRWRGRRGFCPDFLFRQTLCGAGLFQSRSHTIAARLERQGLHAHGQRRRSMRATIAHRIILFMRMAAARAAFCCGAYSPSSESVSAAASAGREVLLQQLPAAAGTQQTPLTDKIPTEIGFIQPPSQIHGKSTDKQSS
jgi:hypothetical protein